ncbi:MAG: hypothetical protein ABIJ40_13900, partial [Bacteroidota bacterium]
DDTNKILDLDKSKQPVSIDDDKLKFSYEAYKNGLIQSGLGNMVMPFEQFKNHTVPSPAVLNKDRTFHYIPYDFHQSGFEKDILEKILTLKDFIGNKLEIYYNGARGLTEFEINCFVKDNKYWKNIGKYTPDFLIITRKDKEIYKALIIETKGEGFAHKPDFVEKKKFVETSFLEQNKAKFGYQKFDFLYLPDSDELNVNLAKVNIKINTFLKD